MIVATGDGKFLITKHPGVEKKPTIKKGWTRYDYASYGSLNGISVFRSKAKNTPKNNKEQPAIVFIGEPGETQKSLLQRIGK